MSLSALSIPPLESLPLPRIAMYIVILRSVSHVRPTENGLNVSVSPMRSPDNYDFFITLLMIGCQLVT